MRKVILLGFILLSKFAFSQTVSVSGKVTDSKGAPVPFAFVRVAAKPYGTYTNADGAFSIDAAVPAKLVVSALNFSEAVTTADGKNEVAVTLNSGQSKTSSTKLAATNFFQTNTSNNINTSGSLYLRSGQQEVHGSRYLFNNWVHGYAISPADSLIQSDEYLFNYDKISGDLLFTSDQVKVFTALKGEVKGFVLFDENVQPYRFEFVPAVNQGKYVRVLSNGPKYKIFKLTNTKYEANNYTTNGITNSGHNYDEYIDADTYFLVKDGGAPQKLELKSKALKTAFAADADKLKKFMADNDGGEIDENYLKALGEAMNR